MANKRVTGEECRLMNIWFFRGSMLAGLLGTEAGIGADLELCKFFVRRDLLGKQGAEYGGDEANGNTDQRRVFEREDGIFLHDVGAQ